MSACVQLQPLKSTNLLLGSFLSWRLLWSRVFLRGLGLSRSLLLLGLFLFSRELFVVFRDVLGNFDFLCRFLILI